MCSEWSGGNKIIQSIKEDFLQRLLQLPGWHSSRRIILIESDDWGMQRMASKEAYADLMQMGYKPHECHYNRISLFGSQC